MPSTLNVAATEYRPNAVASYIYNLAELGNSWYVASPKILDFAADDPQRQASLQLIDQITKQLSFSLNLIGIKTIEEL